MFLPILLTMLFSSLGFSGPEDDALFYKYLATISKEEKSGCIALVIKLRTNTKSSFKEYLREIEGSVRAALGIQAYLELINIDLVKRIQSIDQTLEKSNSALFEQIEVIKTINTRLRKTSAQEKKDLQTEKLQAQEKINNLSKKMSIYGWLDLYNNLIEVGNSITVIGTDASYAEQLRILKMFFGDLSTSHGRIRSSYFRKLAPITCDGAKQVTDMNHIGIFYDELYPYWEKILNRSSQLDGNQLPSSMRQLEDYISKGSTSKAGLEKIYTDYKSRHTALLDELNIFYQLLTNFLTKQPDYANTQALYFMQKKIQTWVEDMVFEGSLFEGVSTDLKNKQKTAEELLSWLKGRQNSRSFIEAEIEKQMKIITYSQYQKAVPVIRRMGVTMNYIHQWSTNQH